MRKPVTIILSVSIAPPNEGARFRMECAFNDLARAVAKRLVEDKNPIDETVVKVHRVHETA
jgi:hypothetical protein